MEFDFLNINFLLIEPNSVMNIKSCLPLLKCNGCSQDSQVDKRNA